jgi:hypothetical protein
VARSDAEVRAIPRGAIKVDLPNMSQVAGHTCGPSALMSICAYFGVTGDLEWEWDFEAVTGIGPSGADPHQLTVPARAVFGLEVEEHAPMTDAALRGCLDRRRPVLMMLQAWADRRRPRYRRSWRDGHWVIAIGHDRAGAYFEDPSLHVSRGFLSWAELDERWHDVGYRDVRVRRYGAAIWKPGVRRSAHASRARRIG